MGNKLKKQVIVVAALIVKDNKIFVAKRADTKKYFPGNWELPAGNVEFEENPLDAIKREILEELHVDIEIKRPIYVFSYNFTEFIHAIEIVYLASIKSNQTIKINPEDHSESRWTNASEAQNLLSKDCPGEAEAIKIYINERS